MTGRDDGSGAWWCLLHIQPLTDTLAHDMAVHQHPVVTLSVRRHRSFGSGATPESCLCLQPLQALSSGLVPSRRPAGCPACSGGAVRLE